MLTTAILITSGLVGLAMLLNLCRLLLGPGRVDRVLALDTLGINAIALVLLAGLWLGHALYFEAALLIAMMGFVSTVVLCRFILSGRVMD